MLLLVTEIVLLSTVASNAVVTSEIKLGAPKMDADVTKVRNSAEVWHNKPAQLALSAHYNMVIHTFVIFVNNYSVSTTRPVFIWSGNVIVKRVGLTIEKLQIQL